MSSNYSTKNRFLYSETKYEVEKNPNSKLKKLFSSNSPVFKSNQNEKTEYYFSNNHWENIRKKYGR